MSDNKSDECCPPVDPAKWDNKEFTWQAKPFVKDSVFCIFHFPLNMGSVISRMWKKVETANAAPPKEDFIILSKDTSMWKSEQCMLVTKEVPDMKNVKISGTFLTKVFEGPYKEAKKWCKEMEKYVKSKGKEMKDLYFFYTTYPKCAKEYGKNYVVGFAKV